MNLGKSKKPIFVAAIIVALFALLFVPFVQNVGIYFAENILLKRALAKPEKWILMMRLIGTYVIFACVVCSVIYWFELPLKNISFVLFFITIVVTSFFILYKASWVFSDDHEFLTSTALGMPHPFYTQSHRFYGHMEYNFLIFTPFYAEPIAYYIVNVIYYITTVFFTFKMILVIDKKINPNKNHFFYASYFLVWFYFNAKSASLFYEVIFTEKMVIMFFSIICYLLLNGEEKNRCKIYIFTLAVCVLATYFKEPVFAALFAIAFSMFIIYKKKLSKGKLFFIFGILLNTVVYLTLFYFLSYRKSSGSYAAGREIERLELFCKMMIEAPYVAIILLLTVYRVAVYFLTLKDGKQVLDIKDTLLFGGFAYILVYFILGITSGYYLLPSMLLAMPAIFAFIFKLLSRCKNVIMVIILIFFSAVVFPINAKGFIDLNARTVKSRENFIPRMEELYFACKDISEVYWYINPEKWEAGELWYMEVTRISLNYLHNYELKVKTINELPEKINLGQMVVATSEIESYEKLEFCNSREGIGFYYYWK